MQPRSRPFAARCSLLLAMALLGGCAGGARVAAPGEEPLRVLVYNVHAGKDAAGQHNLERVAEVVRQTGADVALIQEVDRGTRRADGEDQLATLERLTGHHGAFGRTLDYQGGEYGIAVLSRWPPEQPRVEPLPVEPPAQRAGGSYEPRGALVARVARPSGPVYVLNTHLDASGDDHYRLQEVRRVIQVADSLRALGRVVLVGGDFNATPDSEVIGRMTAAGWRDAWAACGAGEGLTYPTAEPVKRIDYLFLPPGVACRSAAVLDAAASDHRGVLFVLSTSSGRGR